MDMDNTYYSSLPKTWFHKYLFGEYYARNGDPFLMVKIEDHENDNQQAKDKRKAASEEYISLYNKKELVSILSFLNKFLVTNRMTLFYHKYWMGHVCDANGVPLYMKDKTQFEYSKVYQSWNTKNKEDFEKYMKKQDEIKEKRIRDAKKKKEKDEKSKTTLDKNQVHKARIRDDRKANYIGGKPVRKKSDIRKPPSQSVQRKTKNITSRDDSNANYVGRKTLKKKTESRKTREPLMKQVAPRELDPDAFMNPSSRQISTRLNKTRRFRKQKNLKSKMRQLKMEMANLL